MAQSPGVRAIRCLGADQTFKKESWGLTAGEQEGRFGTPAVRV